MSSSNEPRVEATPSFCAICGTPLAPAMGGQCLRCLLSLGSSFGLPGDNEAGDDLLDPMQVRRFGDYELRAEVARGGMGVVYRAWQISLQREVAVKMILSGELAGKEALRLFQNEAHAAANLHHPNIVPVYEIGECETQHYFTMHLVPGGLTIADWARERRTDFRLLAGAVSRVARAVAYAHERGVLHRDLKPSNILWDPVGEPQVTDFGLAKVLDSASSIATFSAQALGSPSYMAPEQMNGRTAEITTATDVYGLGAILYELLSGAPPFLGSTPLETMRRAAEEKPASFPEVPKDLRTICLKCLEKKQADRYVSAAALADDLERFVRGEPVSAVPLTPPQVLLRWMARKPRIAALIALFITSLVLGLTISAWQWRRSEVARSAQAKTLAHLGWQQMTRWAAEGEEPRAVAYLASLIRKEPTNWAAQMYAMSILDRRSFAILAGPEIAPPSPLVRGTARLAPDGSWLVAAGEDRSVRVWETASGKERAQWSFPSAVTAVAVSDGAWKMAIALEDGRLLVTDDPTREPTPLPRVEQASVSGLAFSADGSRLVARSANKIAAWTTGAAEQMPRTFQLDGAITGLAVSASGARVLAWSERDAAAWNLESGAELWRAAAEKKFTSGALSANGRRAALTDGPDAVRIWDVESGQALPPFNEAVSFVRRLAFDESGTHLTVTAERRLVRHDVASGLAVGSAMEHHYDMLDLQPTADGRRMVSSSWDGAVKVWNAQDGRSLLSVIPVGAVNQEAEIWPSHDGQFVLVHRPKNENRSAALAVWRATPTREPVRKIFEDERSLDGTRLSPDDRVGAIGSMVGNRAYVFELESGRVLLDRALAGRVYVHLFSPDMQQYFVLTADGWRYGWSLATGAELWPPQKVSGLVRPAAMSADGTRMIGGYDDGHIRVFDPATGALVQTLDHPGEIKVLRFAPDGSGRFLSASTDGLAHVWDLKSGKKLQTFTGHTHTILAASWHPDSRQVATASYDGTARIWDVATGQPVGAPLQHLSWLSHLEYSPDGKLLATACRDGTARLWHAPSGEPASPLLPQTTTTETVRFTADGKALLVRDQDGFTFWEVATGEPLTVHYPAPTTGGIGMDAVPYRSILSRDGRQVFVGTSMEHAMLWTVPQPRGAAPAWFPEFLEALAGVRFDDNGEPHTAPATQMEKFFPVIREAGADDEYARWAGRLLQAEDRPAPAVPIAPLPVPEK